jgi:hypothetical protein
MEVDRDLAIAAENLQRKLEHLEHVEENLGSIDSSITITVTGKDGIQLVKFPSIEEASIYIVDRMRNG